MDTTERLAHASGEQDGEPGRGAVRRATALAGLGSVADVAAVAQLLTTESRQGVMVAGLLSVLTGTLGLIQLYGRPVRVRAMVMVALIAVGSGLVGAMAQRYYADATAAPPPQAADVAADPATMPPRPTPTLTPSPSVSSSPSPSAGEKIREAEATLRDQDYLDVESGRIGTVVPGVSDLWYVSPYRSLWTAGGGEYPITPVDARPDADACARALAARDYDQVELGKMRPGAWACARTAEGNLAGIRFPVIPANSDAPLTISYVVWHATPAG
ncbi:hypothetical protein ABZ907_05190 [Nonomuraea wenchangensis]